MITYHTLKKYKHDLFVEIPLISSGEKSVKNSLHAIISLKNAGDMGYDVKNKTTSRKNLYACLQIATKTVFTVNQNHTQDIIQINENNTPDDFSGYTADGIVSDQDWPILGVTVADCVPILVFSMNGLVYGILHSGWKGTGIIEKALKIFSQEFGIKPRELRVCLGPAIGPCCYHVTKERAYAFKKKFGNDTVRIKGDQYYLNLHKANINILNRWGVKDIHVIRDCTYCNPKLSSFRRDGEKKLSRMLVLLGRFPLSDKE